MNRPSSAIIPFHDVRSQELETLLLWRLRAACVIFLVGSLLGGLLGLFRPQDIQSTPRGFLTVFALAVLLGVWLFSRRHASLRGLRIVELLLFSLQAVAMILVTVRRLRAPIAADAPHRDLLWTLESCALYWCFLIVLYGTGIPNTARRCAVVVSFLAAVPLTVTVIVGIDDPAIGRILFTEVYAVLVFWVLAAAAVAVYGSYRINLLRESLDTARRLGPYHILRKLGEGGMGEVYLAEHQMLRRPCAIKIIRPEQAGNEAVLRRFAREVQVLSQLTHWNVVEIFDFGNAEDGTFYYAMEYLPGLTLQALVEENGPLSAGRVIHLFRQVCAALREVHAAGLVHRDIKPVNILVCQRGGVCDVVKLLDFGIVQLAPDSADAAALTAEGKFMGTPLFVSPEQIRGRDAVDHRSDLYSLGAAAYFALTGEPPFIRDSVPEIFAAHLRDIPEPPSQLVAAVPHDLEAIVLRCLAKNPTERYASATMLSDHLSHCLAAGEWTEGQAEVWWRQHHPELLARKDPLNLKASRERERPE